MTMQSVDKQFSAVATGKARVFRDRMNGKSCDDVRTLDKFEKLERGQQRKTKGGGTDAGRARLVS